MRRQFSGLVVTALMVVVLVGCAASGASETTLPTLMTATETAAAEPSDVELAQAVAQAYEDYYGAAARTVNAGKNHDFSLDEAVTERWRPDIEKVYEMAETGGYAVTGEVVTSNARLLENKAEGDTFFTTAAFCHDLSAFIITQDDSPIRPVDAETTGTIQVTIQRVGDKHLIHQIRPYSEEWLCD